MNERVIFVEPDDEIDVLVGALKKTAADKVVFVLPARANFLQSIFNAKILRSAAEELGKWIFVITRSKKGREMLTTAGVENFESLDEFTSTQFERVFSVEKKGEKESSAKKSLPKKKIKIGKVDAKIDLQKNPADKINWKSIFLRPSKTLLFTLSSLILALFFFISVLALPGAQIFIKPEKKSIDAVLNLMLVESEKLESINRWQLKNVVTGVPIEAEFGKELTFATISKEFFGGNATGKIKIINTTSTAQRFRPGTRFQTKNGIIFRGKNWLKIPARSGGKNGILEIEIAADERDIFDEIVGARGNLKKGETLKLPGLPANLQRVIWAEVIEDFSGGKTDWKPKIGRKDFAAAQKMLEEKMFEEVQNDLENFLREKNSLEFLNLTLVPESKYLQKEVFEVEMPEELFGKNLESFKISGKIRVQSWAFDKNELLAVLQKALEKSIDEEMEFEAVAPQSIAITVLQKETDEGLKINVVAKGIQRYLIEPRTAAGIEFEKKIKAVISSRAPAEAEKILVNFKEIADAKISLWPFFARKLPQLPENITVKLWED